MWRFHEIFIIIFQDEKEAAEGADEDDEDDGFFVGHGVLDKDELKAVEEDGDEGMLDILFPSNHNIHKGSCGPCFWASDQLIDRFYLNLSIKGYEANKRPHEPLW